MRTRSASLLFASLLFGACGAPPSRPEALPPRHRDYTVWFDPPLPEPAALTVVHESGYRWYGATASTSVTFPAPDGPCTLVLELGGRRLETVWKVSEAEVEMEWGWGR